MIQETRITNRNLRHNKSQNLIYLCQPRLTTSLTYQLILLYHPLWAGVEYAHRFPECPMRQLKWCPDGSASTAWDYVTLPPFSNLSCPIPTQAILDMLLTELHHSPVVSIPLLLPLNSSILPLHLPSLTCTRVGGNYYHHYRQSNQFMNFVEINKIGLSLNQFPDIDFA